jgi:hypothetical protein
LFERGLDPRVWEASAIKATIELSYAAIGFTDYLAKR